MKSMGLEAVKIVDLPKIVDARGNLPFPIKRSYWVYDVPGGEKRDGHAFIEQQEFIVALSGSFDVILNDGRQEKVYPLNRSYYGVYIPNMIWRRLENFSTNSLSLVLASELYDENDYIREYSDFLKEKEIPLSNV